MLNRSGCSTPTSINSRSDLATRKPGQGDAGFILEESSELEGLTDFLRNTPQCLLTETFLEKELNASNNGLPVIHLLNLVEGSGKPVSQKASGKPEIIIPPSPSRSTPIPNKSPIVKSPHPLSFPVSNLMTISFNDVNKLEVPKSDKNSQEQNFCIEPIATIKPPPKLTPPVKSKIPLSRIPSSIKDKALVTSEKPVNSPHVKSGTDASQLKRQGSNTVQASNLTPRDQESISPGAQAIKETKTSPMTSTPPKRFDFKGINNKINEFSEDIISKPLETGTQTKKNDLKLSFQILPKFMEGAVQSNPSSSRGGQTSERSSKGISDKKGMDLIKPILKKAVSTTVSSGIDNKQREDIEVKVEQVKASPTRQSDHKLSEYLKSLKNSTNHMKSTPELQQENTKEKKTITTINKSPMIREVSSKYPVSRSLSPTQAVEGNNHKNQIQQEYKSLTQRRASELLSSGLPSNRHFSPVLDSSRRKSAEKVANKSDSSANSKSISHENKQIEIKSGSVEVYEQSGLTHTQIIDKEKVLASNGRRSASSLERKKEEKPEYKKRQSLLIPQEENKINRPVRKENEKQRSKENVSLVKDLIQSKKKRENNNRNLEPKKQVGTRNRENIESRAQKGLNLHEVVPKDDQDLEAIPEAITETVESSPLFKLKKNNPNKARKRTINIEEDTVTFNDQNLMRQEVFDENSFGIEHHFAILPTEIQEKEGNFGVKRGSETEKVDVSAPFTLMPQMQETTLADILEVLKGLDEESLGILKHIIVTTDIQTLRKTMDYVKKGQIITFENEEQHQINIENLEQKLIQTQKQVAILQLTLDHLVNSQNLRNYEVLHSLPQQYELSNNFALSYASTYGSSSQPQQSGISNQSLEARAFLTDELLGLVNKRKNNKKDFLRKRFLSCENSLLDQLNPCQSEEKACQTETDSLYIQTENQEREEKEGFQQQEDTEKGLVDYSFGCSPTNKKDIDIEPDMASTKPIEVHEEQVLKDLGPPYMLDAENHKSSSSVQCSQGLQSIETKDTQGTQEGLETIEISPEGKASRTANDEVSVEDTNIDFEDFQDFFELFPLEDKDQTEKQTDKEKRSFPTSNERAEGIRQMLQKLGKYNINQLQEAILKIDFDILTPEVCSLLLPFCPQEDEIEISKGYGINSPTSNLEEVGQYLIYMSGIPKMNLRLEMAILKAEFHERLGNELKDFNILQRVCMSLKNNGYLKEFLRIISDLANKINQGSTQRLTSEALISLSKIKSKQNEMTLLTYLLQKIQKQKPTLLEFTEHFGELDHTLNIDLEKSLKVLEILRNQIEELRKEIEMNSRDIYFVEAFKSFVESSIIEIDNALKIAASVKSLYYETAILLGETKESISQKNVSEFLGIFKDLCDEIKKFKNQKLNILEENHSVTS